MYPSGKSWNEVLGKMSPGKKFFHNAISGAGFAAQPTLSQLSVQRSIAAWVDWKLMRHYAVLGSVSEAIGGLNATGEVARGVHGNLRSGGNSLLDYAGFRPCGKRSSCQVRVEQQHEGQLQLHRNKGDLQDLESQHRNRSGKCHGSTGTCPLTTSRL